MQSNHLIYFISYRIYRVVTAIVYQRLEIVIDPSHSPPTFKSTVSPTIPGSTQTIPKYYLNTQLPHHHQNQPFP
jgi:hypothetical protein